MRLVFLVPLTIGVAAAGPAIFADDGPELLATTAEDVTFALDTLGNPRALTSVEALALTYRAGGSVLAWAPDAAAGETLVADAAEDGALSWSPTAGGLWTFENSMEGVATFYVRYSLFPAEGTGTPENPARLVDDAELEDLAASGRAVPGFTFVPYGMTTIDTLVLPAGYALTSRGNDVYQLASATDGMLYDGDPLEGFSLDTVRPGPDRTAVDVAQLSVAYSGDNWAGDADAASSLTFTSPSGVVVRQDNVGTGVFPFLPTELGTWTVSLTAGGLERSALLGIRAQGMLICIQ